MILVTGCTTTVSASSTSLGPGPPATEPPDTVPASSLHGIHKIRHVIVIVQENRSFDSYFGTYPGADGIPMKHGVPDDLLVEPRHPAVPAALLRHQHHQQRRSAQRPELKGRHQRRAHERVRRTGRQRAQGHVRQGRARSVLHDQGQATRRDGLPRLPPDPELLELRPPLRAAGSLLRRRRRLERAEPRGDGVGLVGPLHVDHRPDELPAVGGQDRPGGPSARPARLPLDGPHLAALSPRRELGVLHLVRGAAGLQPRDHGVPLPSAERPHAVDLEPAAAVHRRPPDAPAEPRAGHRRCSSRRPGPGGCRRSRG